MAISYNRLSKVSLCSWCGCLAFCDYEDLGFVHAQWTERKLLCCC